MTLSTAFERQSLTLEHPFRIARGTRTSQEVLVVTITDPSGRVGLGSGTPSRHYGEHPGTVEAVLPELLGLVEEFDDPAPVYAIERACAKHVPHNPAAVTAVSTALHDLQAKRLGVPLYDYLGLSDSVPFESSFTIGIDEPTVMADRAAEAVRNGHRELKLKLGGDDDATVLRSVRAAAPDATLRVDANEAWSPHQALDLIDVCREVGVAFVEQPVSARDHRGLKYVHRRSPLPIAADESCITLEDIPKVADRCDIINIKLMKCGGIQEALRMIHTARAHHLDVMLGCFIETSISIAAAAHLCPLVDYADLDGSLLTADDPYKKSPVTPGAIELRDAPGLGVST